MKIKHLPQFRAQAGAILLAAAGITGLQNASAAIVTSSFETTDGTYSNGTTVIGKTDSSLGGSWTGLFGSVSDTSSVISSNADPYQGALSIRITDASSSTAYGAQAPISTLGSMLSAPFTFSLAMNIQSGSADSGVAQVYFGNATVGNGQHWLRFGYNGTTGGTFYMTTSNGTGTYGNVNLAQYTTLSPFGEYVRFDITIDPTTMKYTSVILTGTLTSVDVTSIVLASNGGTLPWNASLATPGNYVSLIAGTAPTGVVDFDLLTVVPEPSTAALLSGGLLLLGAVSRRKPRVS